MKLKKAEDAPPLAPPKEKTESEMTFTELIAWKSARLKKAGDAASEEKKQEEEKKEEPKPEQPVEEEKKGEPESPIQPENSA